MLINLNLNSHTWLGITILDSAELETSSKHHACLSFCPWSPEQWASSCFSPKKILYGEFSPPSETEGGGWRFPIHMQGISHTFKLKLSACTGGGKLHQRGQVNISCAVGKSKFGVYAVVPAFLVLISGSYSAQCPHSFLECVRVIIKMGKAFLEKREKENVFKLLCQNARVMWGRWHMICEELRIQARDLGHVA